MDGNSATKSSPLKESRLYTDKIYRDGFEIGKIRSTSVFIYDVPDAEGTYFLLPFINKYADKQEKISINPEPNSIAFVKFGLSATTPIVSSAEVVHPAEFITYYNNNKWLQKKLAAEGFDSLDALTNGFTQWKYDRILYDKKEKTRTYRKKEKVADTIFYDAENNRTNFEGAKYYKLISFEKTNYYSVKKYYSKNNQLYFEGHYTNPDSMDFEGPFTYYEESGRISSKGSYHKDELIGKWNYYYDTLNNPLWYTCNYVNGHMEGELTSYYLNGKLKRKEVHQYLDHINAYANRYGNATKEMRDTIISGVCYDEKGNKKPFTPFLTMPEANYNISAYLGQNITYPESDRLKAISGRVIIKFIIETDGSINEEEITKHVSPNIDREAKRVISQMPVWKPACRDDKLVRMYFTQPIKFALE